MFPKGKFNTDISRKGQCMATFRSPSDRKQIGIIAERIFEKNHQRFGAAYYREPERALGYLLEDNHPNTPGNKQVRFLLSLPEYRQILETRGKGGNEPSKGS